MEGIPPCDGEKEKTGQGVISVISPLLAMSKKQEEGALCAPPRELLVWFLEEKACKQVQTPQVSGFTHLRWSALSLSS